jgi:hypothetical protein
MVVAGVSCYGPMSGALGGLSKKVSAGGAWPNQSHSPSAATVRLFPCIRVGESL